MFVPRGVANSYQTLEPETAYVYLVNDHWSPDAPYTFVNLADETLAIEWPIPLDRAELSEKDLRHPRLDAVIPVPPRKTLVLGAEGQLGRALRAELGDLPHIEYATRQDLDLTSPEFTASRHWRDYECVINAAAYTAVDLAETDVGRRDAWAANVHGVAALARIADAYGITLVHVSTDYVFDGALDRAYREDDTVSPLGVYGQTKAAADALVANAPRHYIVRTSWVIGDGRNFVGTMASLAERGIDPDVVDDQVGRLTFTTDLARGIRHLIASHAPYGVYNLTGSGDPASWADVARAVYVRIGHDPARVRPVSTDEYYAAASAPTAPRPRNSVLDLDLITETGFVPIDWRQGLDRYLDVG